MPGYTCRICKNPYMLSPHIGENGEMNMKPYNLPREKQVCIKCFKQMIPEEKEEFLKPE